MVGYFMDEVMRHNMKDDCWIVIDDKVYDITDFIPVHPGGQNLICTVAGKDASDFFHQLHHPMILDIFGVDYCIGTVTKPSL